MSDKLFDAEQVSRCMDGEATEYLEKLSQSEKARNCWCRFHFIRSIMRDSQTIPLRTDFHERVMQALEDEPTVFAPNLISRPNTSINKHILKPLAGLAIAATVAAVTVLGYQGFYNTQPSQPLLSSTNTDSVPVAIEVAPESNLVSTEAEKILATESIGDELDTYLLGHMEQTAGGGNAQAMLPYVRLAGYSESQ
jgi:sigma-E factor negative regulatory protein RseA